MILRIFILLVVAALTPSIECSDGVSLSCSSSTIDVSQTLSCSITSIFSCSQISLITDFGDGDSTTFTNYLGTGLGIPVPTGMPPAYIASTLAEYVCVNTELMQDDSIVAVEFYLVDPGNVEFIVKPSGITVGEYVNTNIAVPSYDDAPTLWSGAGIAGYNIVNFDPPVAYPKGTVLDFFISDGIATVAINTESPGVYRDYFWNGGSLLGPNQNVFVNVITTLSQSASGGQATRTNSFTHSFPGTGAYSLSAGFSCNEVPYVETLIISVTNGAIPSSTTPGAVTSKATIPITSTATHVASITTAAASSTTTQKATAAVCSTLTSTVTSTTATSSTTSSTTTASPQTNSITLTCSSTSIDVTQQFSCTLLVTYSCLSAQVVVDYGDGLSGDTLTLTASAQLGVFTSTTLNVTRMYSTTGAFGVLPSLVCDNSTVNLQQIITVTDGVNINNARVNNQIDFKHSPPIQLVPPISSNSNSIIIKAPNLNVSIYLLSDSV